jgi:ABC-type lipoprotein export system ATPase subunit
MIQVNQIVKSYPDGESKHNHVLLGVDLEMKTGGFTAIMGASGSGKTTLLSILGLITPPDSGTYHLNGENVLLPGLNLSVVRNRKIGFVFQEHRLMPQYTVLDNILLPALASYSHVGVLQMEYARLLMELTGIAGMEEKYPNTLSGGEACRTALCRALIMKPALLLADEPTGQLDALNARNIVSLLKQINEALHTTILMVTHSTETASAAHNIRTLANGILK